MSLLKRPSGFLTVLVFTVTGAAQGVSGSKSVPANYGPGRTDANSAETALRPDTVNTGTFGKLGDFPVDGQIYAQPLYIEGVAIPGQGVKNVVFTATMNDSVYAIDADNPASSIPLWQVNLGTAVPSAAIPDLTDIDPQVGILSTPVIDPVGQVIYVVTDTFEYGAPVFRLHALSLADGHEVLNGPSVIMASAPGTGGASMNGVIQFDPYWHLQRPGLALANGAIYIAFGSHSDAGDYHGWVMAYSASNLQQQLAVFNDTPNGNAGGFWQSGRAPAVDNQGNLYIASGNGDFDGQSNFGGCVLKLSGSTLAVLDWYTPAAWQYLDAHDLDVGSVGPILVPGSQLLVTADKGGRIIFLNQGALGHVEASRGADAITASPSGIFQLALGSAGGVDLVYQHDWDGPLKAYTVEQTSVAAAPAAENSTFFDSQYPGMAVSSNAGANAILWETTGDHSRAGVPGTLHAYDASSLTELWNSGMQPGDVLGSFAKFAVPLIADGRVFVPTFSNQLAIYGLTTGGNNAGPGPQISAVLNGASLLQTSISPGEVVTILGANLGPAGGEDVQLNADGSVSNRIAGAQVLFDGAAAPLLYASSTQVSAVVPFGVSGPSTQIAVQYGDASSPAQTMNIAASAPALFTVSGLGIGEAAIANQDGTVNSASNPAPAGSVVSLYATGLGQMKPAGQDGAVIGADLLYAVLPVQVFIGGIPADVLYAGGAPGMVEGVYQINARIPPLATPGVAVTVTIQAGATLSPAGTWMSIWNSI